MVVAKESGVTDRMIHRGGEQIQGNETRNCRDRGPGIGEKKGGGQAGQHKLSSLGQGPAMSPGSQRHAVIKLLVFCALTCHLCTARLRDLDCWHQGMAKVACSMPASCTRALRQKENFQLFHFV